MSRHLRNVACLVVAFTILLALGCTSKSPSVNDEPTKGSASKGSKGSGSKPGSTSDPGAIGFNPSGQLQPNSGRGDTDDTIYAPDMRFPIEKANAFANSQVYGHGGMSGPGGSECDHANYEYPWRDNFCEDRAQYKTPLCPAGTGHQGQDIRPPSCAKSKYTAVAAEAGTITQIGKYTVYLSADSGRIFRYLHLDMTKLQVAVGQRVQRGDPIGLVSNFFGDTTTTIHLHFEIREPVTDGTATITTWVPPYASLVDAYQRLLAGNP